MAKQNKLGTSNVVDLEAETAAEPRASPQQARPNFDGETYLRAFPDVAKAIDDGVYASPLQHYIEHGRHENRLASFSHRLLQHGRQFGGCVDFYGHSSLAGGWMFGGWSTKHWDETRPTTIVAHFANGSVSGESIAAFCRRDGLKERGSGVLLFVQSLNESFGALTSVDVRIEDEILTFFVEANALLMTNQDVASSVRRLLLVEQASANCREIVMLLSTSGYGRLRKPFNQMTGFVDLYGYHVASGGWFLCGWVTRAWDSEVSPDKFIAHFVDGNLVSGETVTGFYPRDDVEGWGVGFVMFIRESGRPLGSLVSIEAQLEGQSSFILASSPSHRLREAELVPRLRPIISEVEESHTSVALLSFLSRHPYSGTDTLRALSDEVILEFDEVIACPPGGIVIMGWLLAKPGIVRSMRLRSRSMNEPFDLDNCIRTQRPDVITSVGADHGFDDPRCGFIAYVPCTPAANAEVYIEVETAQREVGFRRLPAAKLAGIAAVKRILDTFDVRYGEVPQAYDRTIGPAVSLINRNRLALTPKSDIVEFGSINPNPEFSVIIPLYGRLDFIEYQMAFLSSHPAANDYEFIYVLDDPPKRREAERLFNSTYARFQIPFRTLLMERNVGFAPANNAGLRTARGRYVCFMNSDVFPGPNDWLERLAQHLELNPTLGTIGPMLLYSDGSVQHDGMLFKKLPEFGNWWFPDHPGKGMRRAPSRGLSRNISITGACMLMRRDIAVELGGFDEAFIIGDFEDTDICLRLHAMGLGCAVDMDTQLYHLERKSQATSAQAWRMNLTLYNAWVHESRWAATIALHPLRDGPVVDSGAQRARRQ